mmetsp:Transcript_62157/g.182244  ORF Transcript_62157/g.182244 Transcript_62157/m.182244 type:complete len:851 (+) Transcript_62157:117-2669(+)
MQSGASKKVSQSLAGGRSKGTANLKQGDNTSRIRNTTTGADSGPGRTAILCDGKNVTPKSLVPAQYHKDVKTDTSGKSGALGVRAEDQPTGQDHRALADEAPTANQAESRLKAHKSQGLTKDELARNIDIVLAETETDTLLYFPSLCVAMDGAASQDVISRNKAYEELCTIMAESDSYKEQHAQTVNNQPKSKDVFAAPPSQESVEVNANGWDIYDTFATDPVPKHQQIQDACDKESALTVAQAVKKPGCLFTMNEPYATNEEERKKEKKRRNVAGLRGGLSSGVSTATGIGGGKSGVLGAGPSEQVGGGTPAIADGAAGTPAPGDGAAADEAAAEALAEESADEQEKTQVLPEVMPWMLGAESTIPEELTQAVRVMERIVSQNVFHKQHMIYRNYPTLEELARLDELRAREAEDDMNTSRRGSDLGAGLEDPENSQFDEGLGDELQEEASRDEGSGNKACLQDLFCFDAPKLTNGMNVTCAEWNGQCQDLLAVSYGDTGPIPSADGGLVLFWSLKNPTYPERVIRTRNGVTALNFSTVHPNMVSAGFHDGSVMIWDLRRPSDTPILKSGCSTSVNNDQKHTDTVWETRWVDQGPDKQPPELLVTVSSDGNVNQWSMKKGLEQQLLMPLKRLPNKNLGSNSVYGHKEGVVFRKSSGFCIDFPRNDPSTYLVGTEDGLVHRCSTSYNEYLDTYYGHSGPIYKVRCNPFLPQVFLTCSADWSMRLWTTKVEKGQQMDTPILNFQSTDLQDAVNDVIWAPNNSTSFAAAMDDGRVELWDLSEKPLDPLVVHYPQGQARARRRTVVRFSHNSPVLIAGDDKGCVDVMRMYNTDQSYYSDQEQQERLNHVIMKKR